MGLHLVSDKDIYSITVKDPQGEAHLVKFDTQAIMRIRSALAEPDQFPDQVRITATKDTPNAYVAAKDLLPEYVEANGYDPATTVRLHRIVVGVGAQHIKTTGSRGPKNGVWLDLRVPNWAPREEYPLRAATPSAEPGEARLAKPSMTELIEVACVGGETRLFNDRAEADACYAEQCRLYVEAL